MVFAGATPGLPLTSMNPENCRDGSFPFHPGSDSTKSSGASEKAVAMSAAQIKREGIVPANEKSENLTAFYSSQCQWNPGMTRDTI
jgi:hypothetical protein